MAMARYVNRFCGGSCGILQEFENIANLSWLGKWKDNQLPFLLRLSSGSMIGYYYYEIASWLAWKAPKLFGHLDGDLMMRKSCMCWAVWCAVELYSLYRKHVELNRLSSSTSNKKTLKEIRASQKGLLITVLRYFIFLVQALGWSLKTSHPMYLSPRTQNSLGLAEALIGYWQSWNGKYASRPCLSVKKSE